MAMHWRLMLVSAACLLVACGSDDTGESTIDAGSGGSSGGSGGNGGAITGGSGGTSGSAGASGAAGASGGAAGASCGSFGTDPTCQDCLKTNCCKEAGACDADPDCKGMVECARQCADPTDTSSQCVQDCAAANNAGGNSYNPLILCQGTSCTMCSYL